MSRSPCRPSDHHRSGWRHTEYQSPRFCSFHFASAQFFYPNDTATIRTSDGSDLPAGTVTFKMYDTSANCTANGATGLLYGPPTAGATASIGGVSGQSSGSASTANTTKAVPTDTTSLFWRVTYVLSPANPSYTGVSSVCVEKTVYTAGTPNTATITDDPAFHGQ